MNLIVNRLPYFVYLGNKKYKVNTDYRCMVRFEKRMQDGRLSKSKKIFLSLKDFYPAFFEILDEGLIKEAIDKMLWFYKCGKDDSQLRKGKRRSRQQNIYDYDFDDYYIFGAFYHDYGIDLTKDYVHWWKFKGFMASLSDDNEFVKIKGYRAYTGDNKDILNLKNYHAIPLSKDEQERIDQITAMLTRKEN